MAKVRTAKVQEAQAVINHLLKQGKLLPHQTEGLAEFMADLPHRQPIADKLMAELPQPRHIAPAPTNQNGMATQVLLLQGQLNAALQNLTSIQKQLGELLHG